MAELAPRARLQPALLDRLADNDPNLTSESREQRVMSMTQIRSAVKRDLVWLLNTVCPDPIGFVGLRDVQKSVMNYGVSSLTGRTVSSMRAIELEKMLTLAIERFEPRILARTLKVRVVVEETQGRSNVIVLEIEGNLWAQPMPEALYVRTKVDLETGQFTIEER